MSAAAHPHDRASETRFLLVMSVACAATAFLGFSASYFVPLARDRFPGPSIVHLHALAAFAWVLLLVLQAWLIARGRRMRHRAFGFAGIALATAMTISGWLVAMKTLEAGLAAGWGDTAHAFAIYPLTNVGMFFAFFSVAVLRAREPAVHGRWMLAATVSALGPATARLIGIFLLDEHAPPRQILGATPPSAAGPTLASLSADLILVAALLRDWRVRGRAHPALLVAGATLLAVQLLRIPLSQTSAWRSVSETLLALAR